MLSVPPPPPYLCALCCPFPHLLPFPLRAEYQRNKEVAIGMLLKMVLNIENPYL